MDDFCDAFLIPYIDHLALFSLSVFFKILATIIIATGAYPLFVCIGTKHKRFGAVFGLAYSITWYDVSLYIKILFLLLWIIIVAILYHHNQKSEGCCKMHLHDDNSLLMINL